MSTNALTEDFKTTPWWWEAARRPADADDSLPKEVDVAVIGSGFTGLSAARTLSRGGRDTLVLEDGVIGMGASTRNAGFVGRQLLAGFTRIMNKEGLERAIELYRGAADAYDFTLELMTSENLNCHLSERGRFLPAWNQAQYEFCAKDFEIQRQHTGLEGEMISAKEMSQETRVAGGQGGLLITNTASVHPGLYHQGLLDAALSGGTAIRNNARVNAIRHERDAKYVHTTRGIVKAREVIIATNGYTGSETTWFRRRLVKTNAFMAATEPLDADLLRRLIPSDRTYVDYSRHMFNFWRRAPDTSNRLLLGGQSGLLNTRPERIAALLSSDLSRIFPELSAVRFSHMWHGVIAFSVDRLPHLGYRDGAYYAFGCNGAGLPMGTYLGHKIALRILGSADASTPFDGLSFPLSPSIMGHSWYLPMLTLWAKWQDSRGAPSSGH